MAIVMLKEIMMETQMAIPRETNSDSLKDLVMD